MGGNAETPQHGRGAKGPGFAACHPKSPPWMSLAMAAQLLLGHGGNSGCESGFLPWPVWGESVVFRSGLGANPARRGCDGSRAVPWRGRDDVCALLFSPGQSPSAMEDLLDVENKRMADSLASKVTRLKSLALDIDKDAEEQNRYLDGMDSDFLSVTGLLTGSVKRFSGMARSGRDNRRLLLAVSAALVLIFFILYYLVSRAGT
ncbi:BET1-like protein isoform X1 [Motacilla alba alba]|nr:BET1-like protein isoform X1 [Motacilla alba alba]